VYVERLWRYPVKSLGGEELRQAVLTPDGVLGDRLVHVRNDSGPLTGRSRHDLLTLPAGTDPAGVPTVGGARWDSAEAAAAVRAHAGPDARLAAFDGPERFDVLNLLVATDSAVAELGVDVRRLRPNVLLAGVPRLAERTWEGKALRVGDALIGLYTLRQRCVVITIDPDSGEQDVDVLLRIRHRFAGRVALDSWVIEPGTIAVGDRASIEETDAEPAHVGGWIVGAPYGVPA
jgi:uncharacterized protein